MSTFEELSFSFADFSGKVRLFPLPNLVLFPHVMQPLHVFEPRYRDLLEDALHGDKLIAMAVLAPGWEKDYDGRPPIFPVACLGRITTYHRLKDGTYNVLLLGLRRVRLLRELESCGSFRRAEVQVCDDQCAQEQAAERAQLQRKLRQAFLRIIPLLPEAQEQLDQLMSTDISLGALTDMISYVLDISLADKQALLGEVNVFRRADLLLKHLSSAVTEPSGACAAAIIFPPQFSSN